MNSHAGDLRLVGGRLCLDFRQHGGQPPQATAQGISGELRGICRMGPARGAARQCRTDATAARGCAAPADGARSVGAHPGIACYALFALLSHRGSWVCAGSRPEARLRRRWRCSTLRWPAPRSARGSSRRGRGFAGPATKSIDALEQPFWSVLWSAADLLAASDLALVGECAGEGCSWLFLDTSRKRNRRWCSMEDCGNRAKAKRHYARLQKEIGE